MKLIVGLGNPGKKYDKTRHNAGFMTIDALADKLHVSLSTKKFEGCFVKFKYHGEDIILLKPETYMNNSGMSVIQFMKYFKIDSNDLIVIYDDLDLNTGKLRLREKGGSGGHNGMKSIIQHVGTQNFKRIRIGINMIPRSDTIDFVLGKFNSYERPLIEEGIDKASDAIIAYLDHDFLYAMNHYN